MSYIPITIQRMDPDTEKWSDHLHLHARQVNKTGGGESFAAGADQYHPRLTFPVSWCKALEDIRYNTQQHRIMYRGHAFNIQDYDDYMEQHITVQLVGVAYG
jgi:head-tail adaptor